MPHEVDINHGVDFELAQECLSHRAGKLFRQYREATHGNVAEAEVARLRQAYLDAQHEQQSLSPRDDAAIRIILARRP